MGKATRPFIIIGTPGDRRVTLFQEALAGLDLPPASVIAYADLLENRVDLDTAIPRDAIVRIESPGKDWAVNRALALAGRALKKEGVAFPPLETPGDYIPSWAWYNGFCTCLDQLKSLTSRSDLVWMNHIPDIRQMFDKWECAKQFLSADVPVPKHMSQDEFAEEDEDELELLPRFFIKSRYGSSGTGMTAIQRNGNAQRFEETMYTTLAMYRDHLINTRRLRRVVGEDVLITDEALQRWVEYEDYTFHFETWIPKATIPGGAFDLRIVMIAGRMRHIVVRVSQSPITNLHLLNKRGDFEEVRQRLSDSAWHRIEETCEKVAALFPNSLYMGIDLLITATWNKHYVLEVNAFGDLLPNVLHEGEDTYTAEIKEILKKA